MPQVVLDSLALAIVCAAAFWVWATWRGNKPTVHGTDTKIEDSSKSEYFEYPHFKSLDSFNLQEQNPIPYRPFRWGPNYHITMGLRKGEWSDWIEVDNRLSKYHELKDMRIKLRGDKCVRVMPEKGDIASGALPAKEVLFELAEFLSRRYPSVYQVTREPAVEGDFGWYGEGEIKSITIVPLGVTYDLGNCDPMAVAGLLVQDDLAIMVPGPDGKHYLQAGCVCLPGFWRLEDKIGMPLAEIHTSGDVPQYRERLELSMDRFFAKLVAEKLVLRNNYFFQIVDEEVKNPSPYKKLAPDELCWSDSVLGDEDGFTVDEHAPTATDAARTGLTADRIYFRSERQTLRRLPRSGAILFTFRTYYEPVTKIAEEPGVPGRMASALRSWPDDVAKYKGQFRYKDVLLEYLDKMHAKQVAEGTHEAPRGYPF